MSRSLIVDPPPPPVPPGDRPRRRSQPPDGKPPGRWKQMLPFVLGAVLVVFGIFFGFVSYRMVRDHTSLLDTAISTAANINPPAMVFGKDRIYMLVLGIDYNYDDKGQPYSKDARSDSIMAVGLDFPTKSMKMVSVLRDTEALYNGHDTKINQAYSDGGEPLTDQVVGDFLSMPNNELGHHFDRYVVIKINAVKDFVNAVGGLDVPVTEAMNYDDNWGHLHIHFKPGLVHMNGEETQGYMRFRHDACSDPCRVKRQQQVIHLLVQKLKTQKLNDVAHIKDLLDVINKDVQTNLTFDEEKSLAWSFKDANNADLSKAETIGYTDTKNTTYGGEVLIPDSAQKAKFSAELIGAYGNVTPPPKAAIAAVKPSTIHLNVENGSGIPGLANSAAAKLKARGYIIDAVGNADAFSYDTTQIRPPTSNQLVGERVRSDLVLPDAVIAPGTDATPGPKAPIIVVIGKDFAQAQAVATPSAAPAK